MKAEIDCPAPIPTVSFTQLEQGFYKCVEGKTSVCGIIIYHTGCGTARGDNYRIFPTNPNGTVNKMHIGCFRILMNTLQLWPFIWIEGDLEGSKWKQISGKMVVVLDI